jgi:hypothetical protein
MAGAEVRMAPSRRVQMDARSALGHMERGLQATLNSMAMNA